MKSITKILIALGLVVSFGVGMSGFAEAYNGDCQRGGFGGGYGHKYGGGYSGKKYSEEEYAKFENIIAKNDETIAPILRELDRKGAALNMALLEEPLDSKKVEQLYQEMGALRGKLAIAQNELSKNLENEGLSKRGYSNGRGMHNRGGHYSGGQNNGGRHHRF